MAEARFLQDEFRPPSIGLEASTACQLACPGCPTALGEVGRHIGTGTLGFEDFRRIVDENPWVRRIELSNWGEIFLNRSLVDIMEYAHRRGVALTAVNGVNLNHANDEMLEALVRHKFRKLTCSIDGVTQESYSRYRVKGDLARVIGNVRAINAHKARYRSRYPELTWQFIAFGHNEHEIAEARRMAVDLGMRFRVKLNWEGLYGEDFSPVRDAALVRKAAGIGAASRAEYRDRFGIDYFGIDYAERRCCYKLFLSPRINHDGRVLGCGINYWGDFGDAFRDGLESALNGEKMRHALLMLMGRSGPRPGIPCSTCRVYERMSASGGWLTPSEMRANRLMSGIHALSDEYPMVGTAVSAISGPLRGLRRQIGKGRTLLRKAVRKYVGYRAALYSALHHSPDFIQSGVHRLDVPLVPDEVKGWRPYHLFKGMSATLTSLSCHASVLSAGRSPHPPHEHQEEEILIMLAGEADLLLPDAANADGGMRRRLKAGRFVYYPAHFPHTLEAVGREPANYLMFRWYGRRGETGPELPFGSFDPRATDEEPGAASGFRARLLFEGRTRYLDKLRCHVSTLAPDAGYGRMSIPMTWLWSSWRARSRRSGRAWVHTGWSTTPPALRTASIIRSAARRAISCVNSTADRAEPAGALPSAGREPPHDGCREQRDEGQLRDVPETEASEVNPVQIAKASPAGHPPVDHHG